MKKLLFIFVFTLSVIYSAAAQKSMEKGMITMEIMEITTTDEQMAMFLNLLKGAQTLVYFDGKQHATELNVMGGLLTYKTYQNYQNNSIDLLMDMMGQKMWVNTTADDKQKNQTLTDGQAPVIEYNKADKKQIMGYDCYGVTVKIPEISGMTMKGYVTDEIKTKANIVQGLQDIKFDGFVMEYSINNAMMNLKVATVDVKNDVEATKLSLDTSGYTKMTMEEFKTTMVGFGAGFGF